MLYASMLHAVPHCEMPVIFPAAKICGVRCLNLARETTLESWRSSKGRSGLSSAPIVGSARLSCCPSARPRAASVIALTECKCRTLRLHIFFCEFRLCKAGRCYTLSRRTFNRLLGPLEETWQLNVIARNVQAQKMTCCGHVPAGNPSPKRDKVRLTALGEVRVQKALSSFGTPGITRWLHHS